MNDEELTKCMDSMEQKLGKEHFALIQDDLGMIITGNTTSLNQIKERDQKIQDLEKRNEKLVSANANLFAQVSVQDNEAESEDEPDKSEPIKDFNFFDGFDEKGNFKK